MRGWTKEGAEKWIIENASKYKILSWNNPLKSSFIDCSRNVVFEESFAVFKSRLTIDPDYIFKPTLEERKEKYKKTCIERYGVDSSNKSDIVKEKIVNTNIERYGTKCATQNDLIKDKIAKSNIEKYGVKTTLLDPNVKEKIKETNIKKYGDASSNRNEEVKKRKEQSFLKKFGYKTNLLHPDNKEILIKSNLEKFGVENCLSSLEFRKKIKTKMIEEGRIITVNGKTIKEIAEEKGVSRTTIFKIIKNLEKDDIDKYKKRYSTIEVIVSNILDDLGVKYQRQKFIEGYYYDFLIPESSLIIECDGLYWHSELKKKDYKYHQKKKKKYDDLGYKSLFFREDEIISSKKIVKSIIGHHLKFDKKIGARATRISSAEPSFFDENHLMGRGGGRIYSLSCGEDVVMAIQVKWKNKKEKVLEVSRFCAKNDKSVIGGFSKLIKHVIEKEQPNKIITFIDRRYGDGCYLKNLGWTHCGEDVSFDWVDLNKCETYNRTKFLSNSGYEAGLVKIWDCGQAKWELVVKND